MALDLGADAAEGQKTANRARVPRRRAGAGGLRVASDVQPLLPKRAPLGASVLIVPMADNEDATEAVEVGEQIVEGIGDMYLDLDLDLGTDVQSAVQRTRRRNQTTMGNDARGVEADLNLHLED